MTTVAAIAGMAVAVYAVRIGGLLLAGRSIPGTFERVLAFVPVATLTAFVVMSLAGRPEEGLPRLIAAAAAGIAVWRTRRVWVCLVVGMGVYGLLRLV